MTGAGKPQAERILSQTQPPHKPLIPTLGRSSARPPTTGHRNAFFARRFVVTPIYDGPAMCAGQRVKGPAIIEEPFTTIVLHPKQEATLDRHGNYRVEL